MSYASLDELAIRITQLRPLSATAAQIMCLAEGDRFSAQQLAEIVVTDPALAAKLLRLSNSAYYGSSRRVTSVRDAVVLLGFRTVRSVTTAMCMISGFSRSLVIDERAHWLHSVTVASLAELMAEDARVRPDEAFTAGIVHNIGRLCLDQYQPAALRSALDLAGRHAIALVEAEREVLGYSEAELGGALAEAWAFPPALVEAVRRHDVPLDQASGLGPLAALVVRARFFVQLLGVSDGVEPARGRSLEGGEGWQPGWEQAPRRAALFLAQALDG